VPRKNGKSLFASAIGLYMLCADGTHGAEVYSGATTEKQALVVFEAAKVMCSRTPELMQHFGIGLIGQEHPYP
jgi:phage terminase large subunit-like protein